tara:strand:- start:1255 stop:1431 length:177 start_codon:yes stop_codon:yes gene_type:complete
MFPLGGGHEPGTGLYENKIFCEHPAPFQLSSADVDVIRDVTKLFGWLFCAKTTDVTEK